MYWIVLMVPFSVSNEISMIELEVPLWTPLSLVGAARWNAIVVSLAGDMETSLQRIFCTPDMIQKCEKKL